MVLQEEVLSPVISLWDSFFPWQSSHHVSPTFASQNVLMLWCSLRDRHLLCAGFCPLGQKLSPVPVGRSGLLELEISNSALEGSLRVHFGQQDEVQLYSLGCREAAVASHLRKHQDSQTVQLLFSGHNMQQWPSQAWGMAFCTLLPLALLGHSQSLAVKTFKGESELMFLLSPCDYQPYWMTSIC